MKLSMTLKEMFVKMILMTLKEMFVKMILMLIRPPPCDVF